MFHIADSLGSTTKRMLFTEAIGRESQSNEFPELKPFKMAAEELIEFLYARRRREVLWDHPWRAGGRRPFLCLEHISKTTLARVMKFHGWIDLIEGECSAKES